MDLIGTIQEGRESTMPSEAALNKILQLGCEVMMEASAIASYERPPTGEASAVIGQAIGNLRLSPAEMLTLWELFLGGAAATERLVTPIPEHMGRRRATHM